MGSVAKVQCTHLVVLEAYTLNEPTARLLSLSLHSPEQGTMCQTPWLPYVCMVVLPALRARKIVRDRCAHMFPERLVLFERGLTVPEYQPQQALAHGCVDAYAYLVYLE